jgi:prolyl 4-hydroxylase
MEEYIQEFDNSIPDMLCDEIIQMFELEEDKYNGVIMSGLNPNVKDTKDFVIPQNDSKWNRIEKFLNEELQRCLKIYINNINEFKDEKLFVKALMIQKYQKQKGKYTVHNDFHFENNTYRVFTFIWYLNDVNIGGETSFWNGKQKIVPKKGKLVFFPSSWCYPHEGKMPISNDKYILTNWFYSFMLHGSNA